MKPQRVLPFETNAAATVSGTQPHEYVILSIAKDPASRLEK